MKTCREATERHLPYGIRVLHSVTWHPTKVNAPRLKAGPSRATAGPWETFSRGPQTFSRGPSGEKVSEFSFKMVHSGVLYISGRRRGPPNVAGQGIANPLPHVPSGRACLKPSQTGQYSICLTRGGGKKLLITSGGYIKTRRRLNFLDNCMHMNNHESSTVNVYY